MLRIIAAATLALTCIAAMADTYVRGHVRKDGTYVQPHYRSNPNSTKLDNYSTQGNINPYTGQHGTRVVPPAYHKPSPTLPSYTNTYDNGVSTPAPFGVPSRPNSNNSNGTFQ